MPTPAATAPRTPNRSLSCRSSRPGPRLGGSPLIAVTSRNSPPPATAPASTATSVAGEPPPVDPGHLADAADEPVQPAAALIVVPLLDEDHEVDRSGDQHVRGLHREPLR